MIPNDFFRSCWLDTESKAILGNIASRGDNAFPSVKTLTQETGLARSTVQNRIKGLELSGILTVIRGKGSNRYTIDWEKATQMKKKTSPTNVQASPTDGQGLPDERASDARQAGTKNTHQEEPIRNNKKEDFENFEDLDEILSRQPTPPDNIVVDKIDLGAKYGATEKYVHDQDAMLRMLEKANAEFQAKRLARGGKS